MTGGLTAACGLSMLLAAGMLVPGQASAAESEEEQTLEELTIVGSRIRRDNFNAPAPITVITREEATSAGFNSTTEILQSSTLTSGSSQINNAYGGYVTEGGPGANTLSLRNLGASRTLLLINGRRIAPAGTRGSVGSADLNVLPSAIIDRIEILKDGASSIYGSDAIAGVVNVVTRTNVTGLTLEGQLNRPFEEGAEAARASVVAGLTSDRWSVRGSVDYYSRNSLTWGDRDWTTCPTQRWTDPDTGQPLDFIDPLTGRPKCFTTGLTGEDGVTVNTLGTSNAAGVGAAGSVGTVFNRWRPNPGVTTGLVGFEGVGGGTNNINVRDTFHPGMLKESLISPVDLWTGFAEGSYDLRALGNAELYGELMVHNRSSHQTGGRQLILDYRLGSIMIPPSLAFSNILPSQGATGTTGADPIGVRVFAYYGNYDSSQDLDYYKPTLGIRGDLPFAGWRYDAYTSYSKSDAKYMFETPLTNRMTYASDVVASPVGLDPSLNFGGVTCAINVTNPAERCVPIPAINSQTIGGVFPEAYINYIRHAAVGSTEYDEWLTTAVLDGPLFRLPYGMVQGVFGVEHRRAKINDQPDPNSVSNNLNGFTSSVITTGKDNVSEVFAEVEVPLLASLPLVEELTLNASYRLTDYDSYGADSTWKLGLVYRPLNWVALRSTAGTSYRAPALFEQYLGATTGFVSGNGDPCNNWAALPTTGASAARRANCSSEIPDGNFQSTSSITVISSGGAGTGALAAETSDSLSVGIVLEPSLGSLGSLSFAADFFDIRVDDGVDRVGSAAILSNCYNDPDFRAGGGFCLLVEREATAPYRLFVSDSFTNVSSDITRGFEYTLRYEKDIGTGTLRVTGMATQLRKQGYRLFASDELDALAGTIRYPKWTAGLDAAYTRGVWRFRYGFDLVGKQDSLAYAQGDETDDLHVGTYLTHFASVRFRDKGWEVTAGVRNLFDKDPPMISAGYYNRIGNAPLYSGYDYIGRTGFLNVAKSF